MREIFCERAVRHLKRFFSFRSIDRSREHAEERIVDCVLLGFESSSACTEVEAK
jgi:hypothetical protein